MTEKRAILRPELVSWDNLNVALMEHDEAYAENLLKDELKGRRRLQFLLRIHSRINKLRADREREELRRKAS